MIYDVILADFIGSSYEGLDKRGYDLPLLTPESRITDDTILMIATADALMSGKSFSDSYVEWAMKYPDMGYGWTFSEWLNSGDVRSQGFSFGNGGAMRASLIGQACVLESQVLDLSRESALCSHASKEGIAGAHAIALSVFMSKNGVSPEEIKKRMYEDFEYFIGYDLENMDLGFDSSAENTVPVAIYIGLESKSAEDCIRKCLAVGGDVDTIAVMAMSVYSARGMECTMLDARAALAEHLKEYPDVVAVADKFLQRYCSRNLEHACFNSLSC